MSDRKPIMLAAGGTGGHVFPAQSLAQELVGRGHAVEVMTDRRGLNYQKNFPDMPIHPVRSASPSGSLLKKGLAAVEIGMGLLAASGLLRRLDPALVVGFGGYPTFPTMMAAALAKRPVMLHEQNAVLGRVNRYLAPKVSAIALSFETTNGIAPGDRAKASVTGNPVRDGFAAVRDVPYPEPGDGPIRLLVTGGSQGAQILSEVIPSALAALPEALRRRLRVTQQCRAEDLETAAATYQAAAITADLDTFIDNVPALMASTHLVICRSGASTVSELAAAGRPAVLVPYAHATDDHQTENAKALVSAGAAWMIPQAKFTSSVCCQSLEALFNDPFTLAEMAASARDCGRIDATSRLADLVEQLVPLNGDDDRTTGESRRVAA